MKTAAPSVRLTRLRAPPWISQRKSPWGGDINADYDQLVWGKGYDHNWCVDGEAGTLRPAAAAYSPETGIAMDCLTTQPGVQFYTANWLPEGLPGKGGRPMFPRAGFCLETQHYPCSPNRPQFPSAILRPGEEYNETTLYRFRTR